jgi:hypothetical protein
MRYLKIVLASLILFGFNSCNKDTGLNPGNGMGGSYVITALINGQAWGADDGFAKYVPPFGLEIRGSYGTSSNIIINISPYNGMDSYPLNGITKVTYYEGGKEYTSTTGQITVTAEDNNYIDGIFSCEVISNSGGPSLNFTSGEFHVPKF